jgi:DNA primase
LQGRCIDYPAHEIGYNSGGLHGESKNHHLVNSMEKYGLLKPLPVRGSQRMGEGLRDLPAA